MPLNPRKDFVACPITMWFVSGQHSTGSTRQSEMHVGLGALSKCFIIVLVWSTPWIFWTRFDIIHHTTDHVATASRRGLCPAPGSARVLSHGGGIFIAPSIHSEYQAGSGEVWHLQNCPTKGGRPCLGTRFFPWDFIRLKIQCTLFFLFRVSNPHLPWTRTRSSLKLVISV